MNTRKLLWREKDGIIMKHNRSLKVAVQGPDFWPTPSTKDEEYYLLGYNAV
jgi:hypothetical protein